MLGSGFEAAVVRYNVLYVLVHAPRVPRGVRSQRRPGWTVVGRLDAAWQVSRGFGIRLPLVCFLLATVLVAAACYGWSWWRRRARPPFGRRLLLADLACSAASGTVPVLLGLV
ncbi:hypothetical protein ACH495_27345 [Micromonospora sp. NPDC018662]|uniref:hypothetical protein n=1 Tax=Micromonospora sp. NPDC018662 TaxID=3364238 RepID=UPI00379C9602